MIRYIKGYLLIRVEGYSPERFLNACSHRGIELWGLRSAGGAYEMYMTLKDFRKIKALSKKTGTKVRVRRRYGLPFFLHRYRRRKLFFAGAFLAVCLVYILTLFIWEIDIRGNLRRTDEALLSFLRSRDVYCGMTAGSVDCDQIADDLRGAYADLVWVSASVHGTRLVIQVKENEHLSAQTGGKAQETEGTDLAATQDCTILSIVTRQGTPLVHEGDQVKKGDLLVNGRLDLKNDAGEVTGYRSRSQEKKARAGTIANILNIFFIFTCLLEINVNTEDHSPYIRICPPVYTCLVCIGPLAHFRVISGIICKRDHIVESNVRLYP